MEFNFVPGKVTFVRRKDVLPHLEVRVLADGEDIGYVEIHLHSHRGRDKKLDVSFGFTAVVEEMPVETPASR